MKKYDLVLFAELRGYLSSKEIEIVYERLVKNEEFDEVMRETEKKYASKYGSDRSKWPKDVLEKIEKEFDVEN